MPSTIKGTSAPPALRGRRHCYFHFHGLGRNMKFTLDSELVKQIELGRTYGNR